MHRLSGGLTSAGVSAAAKEQRSKGFHMVLYVEVKIVTGIQKIIGRHDRGEKTIIMMLCVK